MTIPGTKYTRSVRREWDLFDREKATVKEYEVFCQRLIDVGDSLLAHDVAKFALSKFPGNPLLSQKAALALINAGSPLLASRILEEVVANGDRDVETHGILASAYKDLWEYAADPETKQKYSELAIARYKEGFSTTSFDSFRESRVQDLEAEYYPCINVAFMYLFSGDVSQARNYADRALKICQGLKERGDADYWSQATIGEAYLIDGKIEEASEAYAMAVSMPDAEPAKIASTRTQALQIANAYDGEEVLGEISAVFPMMGVLACSGHVIDNPEGALRFPPEAEELAKREIETILDRLDCSYGFSSVACGTDILFAEAMLARGREVHLFIPFNKEDFIETSVRRAGGNWVSRFDKLLRDSNSVHYVTEESYLGDDNLFSLCNDVLVGFAALRAHTLDEQPKLLVLWDGKGGKTGGTGQLVEKWRTRFAEPEIINIQSIVNNLNLEPRVVDQPAPVVRSGETMPAFLVAKSRTPDQGPVRFIKTMLFADVQGFSNLPDSASPLYVKSFLGGIAKIVDKLPRPPAFLNTWGDSIFCVFDRLEDGLALALDLRDFVVRTDWKKLGLPQGFGARIALHVGPAYAAEDPILKKTNFFGRHVNQAARIEPIALPGCVYVSETVAALLSFGQDDFDFEYVGNVELAKGFGSFPIYLLQRPGYIDY